MLEWRVPLSDIDYGPEEEAAVLRVLKSRWFSMGPEVQAFEAEFAAMQSAKFAFAVTNGTAGLHLSLVALGIGPGDEVIQPALNFVAAANMTVALGATPVFADVVGLEEPTIDPNDAERLITPKTKAIIVMHYGGNLCRMSVLSEICKRHRIALIEDACHAVGAVYRNPDQSPPHGAMAGSIGDVGTFSFFSNKNLATGEGGMVVTNRDDLAAKFRLLRSHGMTTLTWDRHRGHASSYDVVSNGYNYRLDEIHAALGRAQLIKLARNNDRRRLLLGHYSRELKDLAGWTIPFVGSGGDSSAHLMVAVAPTAAVRTKVVERLREARIQTSLHYPCISDFEAFVRWRTDSVSHTRKFQQLAITLPLFPTMSVSQVELVCAIIKTDGRIS